MRWQLLFERLQQVVAEGSSWLRACQSVSYQVIFADNLWPMPQCLTVWLTFNFIPVFDYVHAAAAWILHMNIFYLRVFSWLKPMWTTAVLMQGILCQLCAVRVLCILSRLSVRLWSQFVKLQMEICVMRCISVCHSVAYTWTLQLTCLVLAILYTNMSLGSRLLVLGPGP